MRAQNFALSLQMTQPALDLVIAALERIRESTDRAPRASRTVLAQLRTASPVAVSLRETSASPTGRRLQALPSKAELLEPIRERVRLYEMRASRLLTHTNRFRRRKSGRGPNVHR